MKIRFGKPKKCLCVSLSRKFRAVPWIEKEMSGEVFFGWLCWTGYVYW